MELHHKKHHQTYITNANGLFEQYSEAEVKGDVGKMIALQPGIKFNAGGHVNHALFWENLAPKANGGGELPSGKLKEYMDKKWSNFDAFKKEFSATTAAVQGSGWGWLGYCPVNDAVCIKTTANQDPCSTTGAIPLLGVDVWEHAYYLDYKNVRPDYLNAIFEVLNFKKAEERLTKALKK